MILAFNIVVLVTIGLSAIVGMAEKDLKRQNNMIFLSIMGMVAFLASALWL